jgi:hypothetical protein
MSARMVVRQSSASAQHSSKNPRGGTAYVSSARVSAERFAASQRRTGLEGFEWTE